MLVADNTKNRKDYPDILITDQIAIAGRKILSFHFARMIENERGTILGIDVEALHDMRVSTRRMRVTVDLFNDYFAPNMLSLLKKGLQKTGKTLGQVRDLDVLIQMLDDDFGSPVLNTSSEMQSFYRLLKDAWFKERLGFREKMLSYLGGNKYNKFKTKFITFVKSTKYDKVNFSTDPQLCSYLADITFKTFYKVVGFNIIFPNPSLEELHALRIAIKQLRYTLEFFMKILGSEARNCIELLKGVQNILGEINDKRNAIARLRKHSRGLRLSGIDAPYGLKSYFLHLNHYMKIKEEGLSTSVNSFIDTWYKFDKEELSNKLQYTLSFTQ